MQEPCFCDKCVKGRFCLEAVLEMTTSYQPLHFYRPCQVTLTCITNGLFERSTCWLHHLSTKFVWFSYQPLHFYRPCQVTLTCITNGLFERSTCWLHHLSTKFVWFLQTCQVNKIMLILVLMTLKKTLKVCFSFDTNIDDLGLRARSQPRLKD